MSARGQLKWGPAKLWRWRADRARDRRQWGRASTNYARYLAQIPGDGPIWIQLGHALKERGDLAGAKAAYERALTLEADGGEAQRQLAGLWIMERMAALGRASELAETSGDPRAAAPVYAAHLEMFPNDGHVWVQYGETLKALGDPPGAMIAYRQAAALPESEESGVFQLACLLHARGHEAAAEPHFRRALELAPRYEAYRNLHGGPTPLARVSSVRDRRCLALDISDLVNFLAEHGRVSGIQRVQLELVKAVLSGDGGRSAVFDEIVFCFSEYGWAWAFDDDALKGLLAYAEAGEVDIDKARAMRERIRVLARPLLPAAGSAYVVLGGFWGEADARVLTTRMRALGVAFGVLAHDLFAITLPELCEEGVGRQFEATLRAGAGAWDFILANSVFTAGEVRDFLARNSLRLVPVIPLPLAHGGAIAAADVSILPDLLRGERFVLCVGTIEPRKNHAGLIQAWAALAERRPDLPWLVLAGRAGWRSEDLVRRLSTGVLETSRIRWLPEVSEPLLGALYGRCLFTVFPSFAEGWGLPIGESLAHGKVCVTSNRTAMPEVGGQFAVYADPHDTDDLARALESLLTDERALARRAALIKRSFRPRTWSDVADDMVAELSALLSGSVPALPTLAPSP